MLSFNINILEYIHPIAIGAYLTVIGVLMSSKLPTFATKKLVIKKEHISFALILTGLFIGSIIMEPWVTLPLLGTVYICSFPFSIISYKKQQISNKE